MTLTRYFDYAATSPPLPAALEAQAEAARRWFGNPASGHRQGLAAKAELDRLKRALGALCGFTDGRLVLTSGATEANNWVIDGVMGQHPAARVLVAADVHDSVWNCGRRYGDRMDVLELDAAGRLTLTALAKALRPETRLFCCSHAANETGVIHDVAGLTGLCERRHVLCLVDGVQAVGHIPVNLADVPCEFYVFSAHKFGGPRGCGGVFLRVAELPPLLAGGGQEWGMRPGTENLPGLAGALAALDEARAGLSTESTRLRGLAQLLLAELTLAGSRFEINGDPDSSLPGFVSLSFAGHNGQTLVADLAVQDFAVASGSACHSEQPHPSRVILALGKPATTALGTLRISFGHHNHPDDVRRFAAALGECLGRQQVAVSAGAPQRSEVRP